ncbi:MAG: hypothetical protein A2Z24_00440 [Candidatus Woykebacteria bacterium RBG_16_44_10]|uniref:Dockerin domain-containing protein n=1 Tax=Candidatus Woykebacteria bacterium RBG_16_44_10 TaxID=1802597 RepID=A0A1G1WDP2_9BACT|nr:MAG: hypothetical protein A2Z24_00440 [Candidatus Woykebacteria bacterium RBG_16_44_10]
MKPADLLKQYREHINPPYSHRDIISVFGTLFLLLAIPLTTIFTTQGGERVGGSQLAVKAQTVSELDAVRNESFKLLKLNDQLVKAIPGQKGKILEEMASVANSRKARMESLLEKNPKEVLKASFPKEIVASFPAEIQKNLEQPVTVSGDLEVLATDDFAKKQSKTQYFLNSDKERFSLYPTKKLAVAKSGTKVEISGIKIDNKIIFEGTPSQDFKVLGTLTDTLGEQKTVVILVNFQNDTSQPFTTATAQDVTFTGTDSVSSYYLDASYNKTWLTGDAYGWYTMAINKTCDYGDIEAAAIDAADPFVNFQNYSRIILAFPGSSCGWAGLGTIGKWAVSTDDGVVQSSISWIIASYFGLFVVGHEFGHNLGVYHANALDCGSVTLGDSCTDVEYGDIYDIMGGYNPGHHNAAHKQALNWFEPSNVVTATDSTVYWLEPLETATSGPKVIKVPRNANQAFYVEYRQAIGKDAIFSGDSDLLDGVLIHLVTTNFEEEETWLLDASPNDAGWHGPAFTVDHFYLYDPVTNITITPSLEMGGLMYVEIDLGDTVCERANPLVTIDPTSVLKAPGETATFSVSVTNNDTSPCGSSAFTITRAVPDGWSASLAASELTISPGATSSTTLSVTSSVAAPEGFYDITVTAANKTFPVYNSSDTTSYEVDTQAPATVDIKADSSDGPITIAYNTATTLSWSSSNATSCSASGVWSGTKATSGSQSSGSLTVSSTFTLTCSGLGGSASDSVTVNVSDQGAPLGKLGDLNGDGLVNIRDASILVSRWNSADATADLNHDGMVNIRDASILVSRWGS